MGNYFLDTQYYCNFVPSRMIGLCIKYSPFNIYGVVIILESTVDYFCAGKVHTYSTLFRKTDGSYISW